MRALFKRIAVAVAALALAGYLGVCGYLYFGQQKMVFPGKPADKALAAELTRRYPAMREVTVATPDGAVLAGRLLVREGGGTLVLYFGGNLDEGAEFLAGAPEMLPGLSIATLDYRGYGASTGTPSEAALKADALLVYDRLRAVNGGGKVVVMGRSLGTAMAAHVAANREVAALILVTPFDSIAAVGQDRHPFIPVTLLLKNPFDVTADAAKITAPTLILVATHDVTVAPERARRLIAAWRGPLATAEFAADHGSILRQDGYWPTLRRFIEDNAP